METDETINAHEGDFPMGVVLLLTVYGALWFGLGVLLGRAIWGPAG